MVKVINKTSHQRIYTLTDGSTLRVGAFDSSKLFEDKLVCSHLESDEKAGIVEVISVSHNKEVDTKTEKGGKK